MSSPTDFIVDPDVVLFNLRATSGNEAIRVRQAPQVMTRLPALRDEPDFRLALMEGVLIA